MFIYIDKYVHTHIFIYLYISNLLYIITISTLFLFRELHCLPALFGTQLIICVTDIYVYTHTVKMCIIGMGSGKGQKSG